MIVENGPSSLAMAIATRKDLESQRSNNRGKILAGLPDETTLPDELNTKLLIISATRIDQMLKAPKTKLNPAEEMFGYLRDIDDETILQLSRLGEPEIKDEPPITPELAGSILRPTIAGMMDTFAPIVPPITSFSKELREARRLSRERGIHVEDVYLKEDSYEELIRRITNPVSFVRRRLTTVEQVTPELFRNIIVNALTGMVESMVHLDDEADNNFYSLFSDEQSQESKEYREAIKAQELAEMKQEITDGLSENDFESEAVKLRGAFAQVIKEDVIRFWGTERLVSLPQTLQKRLNAYVIPNDESSVSFTTQI